MNGDENGRANCAGSANGANGANGRAGGANGLSKPLRDRRDAVQSRHDAALITLRASGVRARPVEATVTQAFAHAFDDPTWRRIYCCYYDTCLNAAQEWESWSCRACTVRAEVDPRVRAEEDAALARAMATIMEP